VAEPQPFDSPIQVVSKSTKLENLEYSGISQNVENSGNSRGNSVQHRGKTVTNKVGLVRHSNI